MIEQKFKRGQRVIVDKKLPKSMKFFCGAGREATIVGSYAQLYKGYSDNNFKEYSLQFDDGERSYWYPEDTLKVYNV